jgi:TolB-like protein
VSDVSPDAATAARHRPCDIFVSYTRDDQKHALPIVEALKAAGFSVWWDGMISGGERFLPATEAALENARAVVVLWSAKSVTSHWVRDEATRGRDRGCIVPLSIDGTEAPLGFRQFQTIGFSQWRGRPDAPECVRLVEAVARLCAKEPVATDTRPAPPAISRRALMMGGATALVAAGGLGAWYAGLIGGGGPTSNSVAVLPFVNLSGGEEQNYIAEGLSAELRAVLARNAALRVSAQASSAAVRELNVDAQQMAARLRVAFLLDGNVRVEGQELRVAAELIDGASGLVTWTKSFAQPMASILDVQSEIAGAVTAALTSVMVGDVGSNAIAVGGTANVAAYDAYLRGRDLYARASTEAMDMAALAQFDAAIAADPRFAAAHAARARSLIQMGSLYGDLSETRAHYAAALVSARRAVALAPGHGESQATLGFVLSQGHLDVRAARAPFERARTLGHGDASVLARFAEYAALTGRRDDARSAIDRAVTLDPLNPLRLKSAGIITYWARAYADAFSLLTRAVQMAPDLGQAQAPLGDVLLMMERLAEARAAYVRETVPLLRETGLAIVDFRLGRRGDAEAARQRIVNGLGSGQVTYYQQAQIAAQWNEPGVAMAALRAARAAGDSGLLALKVDPMLDQLRRRADFVALLGALHFD